MLKEIFLLLISLIFPKSEDIYIKEYMIDTDHIPQYIYWIDGGNVLLSSYGYTEIFNTDTRKRNTIDTCNECIYGYDRGFIYCRFEHRGIESVKEFSTTLYIYNMKGELLYSKDIFPTVIPTVCLKDYVILESAYSFLEQKTYILKNDVLSEIPYIENREVLKGVTVSHTIVSKRNDLKKVIVLDEYSRLWVYTK